MQLEFTPSARIKTRLSTTYALPGSDGADSKSHATHHHKTPALNGKDVTDLKLWLEDVRYCIAVKTMTSISSIDVVTCTVK